MPRWTIMIVVGMTLWAVILTGMRQVPVPKDFSRNDTGQVVKSGEHDSKAPPADHEQSRDDDSPLDEDIADDESADDDLLVQVQKAEFIPLSQGRERVHYAPRMISAHVTELLRRPPRRPVA